MKHIGCLLKKELKAQFYSPATYAAGVLFLLLMGVFFVLSLSEASKEALERNPVETFMSLFWIPVWFMIPMLTMRSLAEERRLGTLEVTLTTPSNAFEIVLSKWCAAYILYVLLWMLTLLFPLITAFMEPQIAEQGELLNPATLVGSLLFIAISGLLYVAVGIFSSSLTRSQLIAAMLSFCILLIFTVGAKILVQVPILGGHQNASLQSLPDYLRTFQHLEDFSQGIVDTRPLFLYLSNAFLLLGLTSLVVRSKA